MTNWILVSIIIAIIWHNIAERPIGHKLFTGWRRFPTLLGLAVILFGLWNLLPKLPDLLPVHRSGTIGFYVTGGTSLAFIVAGIHWLLTEGKTFQRKTQWIVVGGFIFFAGLFWITTNDFMVNVIELLGIQVNEPTIQSIGKHHTWLAVLTILGLAIWRSIRPVPIIWKLLLIGGIVGSLIGMVLAYTVTAFSYSAALPNIEFSGAAHDHYVIGSLIISMLILASGSAFAIWTIQPASWIQRLLIGGIIGGMAAMMLFIVSWGNSAGIITGSSIYNFIYARQATNQDEWVFQVYDSVRTTVPIVMSTFYGLLGLGIVLGGISALPIPIKGKTITFNPEAFALVSLLMVYPLLYVILLNAGLVDGFAKTLSNTNNLGGGISFTWSSWHIDAVRERFASDYSWIYPLMVLPVFALYLAAVATAIYSLRHPLPRRFGIIALIFGGVSLYDSIGHIGESYPNTRDVVMTLIFVMCSIEIMLSGWRVYRHPSEQTSHLTPLYGMGLAMTAVLVPIILAVPIIIITFKLVWIDAGPDLLISDIYSSPIGIENIVSATSSYLYSSSIVPSLLFLVFVPAGLFIGWLCAANYAGFGKAWRRWSWLQRIYRGDPLLTHEHSRGFRLRIKALCYALGFHIVFWSFMLSDGELPKALIAVILLEGWVLRSYYGSDLIVSDARNPIGRLWRRIVNLLIWVSMLIPRLIIRFASAVSSGHLAKRLTPLISIVLISLALLTWFYYQAKPDLGSNATYITSIFLILVVLAYQGFMRYIPPTFQQRTRILVMAGLVFVSAGFASFSRDQRIEQSGLARLDGDVWEKFTASNSPVSTQIILQIFRDAENQMWFAGDNGSIVAYHDGDWRSVQYSTDEVSMYMRLLEDHQGRIWQSAGTSFRLLDYNQYATENSTRVPSTLTPPTFTDDPNTRNTCPNMTASMWQGSEELLQLGSFDSTITNSVISPSGDYLVTIIKPDNSTDETIAELWDSQGHFIEHLRPQQDVIYAVRFSPDNTHFVTIGIYGSVELWTIDGQSLELLEGFDQASELDSTESTKLLMNIDEGDWLEYSRNRSDENEITSIVSFSADGQRLLTHSSRSKKAHLWSSLGNLLHTYDDVNHALIMPSGDEVLVARQTSTDLISDEGQVITTYPAYGTEMIVDVQINADATQLLTVNNHNVVQVWDIQGTRLAEVRYSNALEGSLFDPTGQRFLSVWSDNTTRTVQLNNIDGTEIASYNVPLPARASLSFSGVSGEVSRLEPLPSNPEESPIPGIAFSDDGMHFAIGYLQNLSVYNAQTGDLENTLNSADKMQHIVFSPDGQSLAAFDEEGNGGVWDIDSDEQVLNATAASFQQVTETALPVMFIGGRQNDEDHFCLVPASPITDTILDTQGTIWLATFGSGLIRVDGQRHITDAHWISYTSDNSPLPSNDISDLHPDSDGGVWIAVDGRVMHFVDDMWESLELPSNVTTHEIFQDSQRQLWIGIEDGAIRFDGENWATPIVGHRVNKFVEANAGILWMGTPDGVIRYNTATNNQDLFTAENSGLQGNLVLDLDVDADNNLWVSSYESKEEAGNSLIGYGLFGGFFGVIGLLFYRGVTQHPETEARRLSRQIRTDPDALYPLSYHVLSRTDHQWFITEVEKLGDSTGTDAIKVLHNLSQSDNMVAALDHLVDMLNVDRERSHATTLSILYGCVADALRVQSVTDITRLELTVNPGSTGGSMMLNNRHHPPIAIPPFSPPASLEVWQRLEQVSSALSKYQEVDDTADQLSYLAETLTIIERAMSTAQHIPLPEFSPMMAMIEKWRQIITDQIAYISGTAELRMELRSRQIRRSETVTLALHLQNRGRTAAEAIAIHLYPSDDFDMKEDTTLHIPRLPAGRTEAVEFTIYPKAGLESTRIVLDVQWRDRIADNHQLDFADAVSFFETPEEFNPIPNPYIVGHPVRSADMFFGRDDIFKFILENLDGTYQQRTIVIYGQRRTGKTSLLYQLLGGQLGDNLIPLLVDMQELAMLVNSTGDLLGELAYQIGRTLKKVGISLDVPEIDSAAPTRVFNRFLDDLEDALGNRRIVIIFDEFEIIEDKIIDGKLDAEILGYFRSLIQHRSQLCFIFSGTHRLEEMSHDYWSILFNIALYRHVSFLSETDATALIRQPITTALDVDDLAVEKIIKLTAGHPYFIQLICWALVNECNTKRHNYATINDINDALADILTTGEAHFAYIWKQASSDEKLVMATLAHYLASGQSWAKPTDILQSIENYAEDMISRPELQNTLDRLTSADVLEATTEGAHRFPLQDSNLAIVDCQEQIYYGCDLTAPLTRTLI